MAGQLGIGKAKKGAWRTVSVLSGAQFVDAAESEALPTLFPALQGPLGLNVGHLGTILSLRQIIGLVFSPLWSIAADRYNRKSVLIWGTGMWGLWTVLVGFSSNYRQLLVFSLVSAIGLFAREGAKTSLISDLFPEQERGKALGTIIAFAAVGVIIAILIFGYLIEASELGWRIAYWLFGGLSVLSGVLIWLFAREPVHGETEAALSDVIAEIGDELESRHRFELKKVPPLFRIPTIVVNLMTAIPDSFVGIGLLSFLTVWLADDRGFSPGTAAYMLGAFVVGMAIGGAGGGALTDWADRLDPRRGRILVGQVSLTLIAVVSYFLYQTDWSGSAAYWVLILLLGALSETKNSGAIFPMMTAVVVPEIRATSKAVVGSAWTLAAAAVSYIIGRLGVRIGLTATLFWAVTFASAVLAVMWFAYYPTYGKDTANMQEVLFDRRAKLTEDTGVLPADIPAT